MRKILFSILILSVLAFSPVFADSKKEAEAVKEAEQWLKKVDGGKYKESYQEAASLFKDKVSFKDWGKSLKSARIPLGKLVSRRVLSKQYLSSLPGLPDGEYVVIQFQADFEKKKSAVETVTPLVDKDGKWKVSGYFIR